MKMCHRYLPAGAALAVALSAVAVMNVPVVGQAPATVKPFVPPAPTYNPPRTPWGDPDLQGVWDYQSRIPMQRPAEFVGKARMTDEELAEWAKLRSPNQDQCGYGTKVDMPCTVAQLDNVGGYNEFWNNRRVVQDNRTSLIEDPAD